MGHRAWGMGHGAPEDIEILPIAYSLLPHPTRGLFQQALVIFDSSLISPNRDPTQIARLPIGDGYIGNTDLLIPQIGGC